MCNVFNFGAGQICNVRASFAFGGCVRVSSAQINMSRQYQIQVVNLHQAVDFNEAVSLLHSRIKLIVSERMSSGYTPRTLLIGKSAPRYTGKRFYRLRRKGYSYLVVIAELEEGISHRLLGCGPDSCALVLAEALSQYLDYGEGIRVTRQTRKSSGGGETQVSMFVCFSSEGKF